MTIESSPGEPSGRPALGTVIDDQAGWRVNRKSSRATFGIVTAAFLAVVSSGVAAQERGGLFEKPAMGPLVIVGGKLESSNEPVFRAILGFRVEARPICVLPTTPTNANEVTNSLVKTFERHGGLGAAKGVTQLFTKPFR